MPPLSSPPPPTQQKPTELSPRTRLTRGRSIPISFVLPERPRANSTVITFTVALSSLWLKVVYKKKFSMSWGPATVYVHQKLTESEHAARLEGGADAFDDDQAVAYPLPAGLGRADEEDMDSLLGHATSSHLASTSSRPPSYASSSDIVARDAAVPASLQSNSSESWAMVSPAPSELD